MSVVKNANNQVFGKVLTSEFVSEHINFPIFFFYFLLVQVSFPQCMAWKIFDHILRTIEESVLESQSNGANFHHLFRHLRSFQKLCSNPMAKKKKVPVPGPSRSIPLQGSLPRNASGPHRIHPWSQGLTRVNWGHRQEGLGGYPVENLGIRFQNLRKL